MRILSVVLCAPIALLSACGGDGSSSPSATSASPTPTPTPSASPTPSPTPGPSGYTRFDDLSGDQEFSTACSTFGNSSQDPERITPFEEFFTYSFTQATQTWRLAGQTLQGTTDSSFGPQDIVEDTIGVVTRYERGDERFSISTPQLTVGSVNYARTARQLTLVDGAGGTPFYRCVFGVPTRLDDPLPSTEFSFGQAMDHFGYMAVTDNDLILRTYQPDASTSDIEVDPDARTISIRFEVAGPEITRDPNTGTVTIASTNTLIETYRGTATYEDDVQGFTGELFLADQNPANAEAVGTFSGAFFGPQGEEIAIAYQVTEFPDDVALVEIVVSALGVRD